MPLSSTNLRSADNYLNKLLGSLILGEPGKATEDVQGVVASKVPETIVMAMANYLGKIN